MIGTGIHDQFGGRSTARACFHPHVAVLGRSPVVEFTDHDECRDTQLLRCDAAQRVIGDCGLKFPILRDVKDINLMGRGHVAGQRPGDRSRQLRGLRPCLSGSPVPGIGRPSPPDEIGMGCTRLDPPRAQKALNRQSLKHCVTFPPDSRQFTRQATLPPECVQTP
jgi:hypothetical protein